MTENRALHRLLDYYQHTAARAQARQNPAWYPAARARLAACCPGSGRCRAGAGMGTCEPCQPAGLPGPRHRTGRHTRVTALTALAVFLRGDGPWTEAISRRATAFQAARHLGDRLGQANALTRLGDMRRLMTGDYPGGCR
jgi:hypothetical protein